MKTYEECKGRVHALFEQGKYIEASEAYEAALAEPVHWFFEKVFVNVDDKKTRDNRISLLKNINLLFSQNFANLAAIHVPEELKPKRGKG